MVATSMFQKNLKGRGIKFMTNEVVINMTKVGEVYKCEICGNVVEVKEAGAGQLVCCGKPMVQIKKV